MATVTVRGLGNYQMLMATADHGLISDEPKGVGDGLGPGAYRGHGEQVIPETW